MKRLGFILLGVGLSALAVPQKNSREYAVLKKIKAVYAEMDKAMSALDEKRIMSHFVPGAKIYSFKGKPTEVVDAAQGLAVQFELNKSLAAKSTVKTFRMTGSRSAETRTIVVLDAVLPQRGYPDRSSTVKVRSESQDFWSYSKEGWRISKVRTIRDQMWVQGKLTSDTANPKLRPSK